MGFNSSRFTTSNTYVGVIVNDHLTWSNHIDSVTARSRKLIGFLYRTFYSHCGKDTFIQIVSFFGSSYFGLYLCCLGSVFTQGYQATGGQFNHLLVVLQHVAGQPQVIFLFESSHLVSLYVALCLSLYFCISVLSNLTFVRNDILLHRVSGSRRLHNLQLICPFAKTNSFKTRFFCFCFSCLECFT